MDVQSRIDDSSTIVKNDLSLDEKDIIKLILEQPFADQNQAARAHFRNLLGTASLPKHASGNACIKLCYFVELCRKSSVQSLRDFAFSSTTSLDLVYFYVEWNEKNQHRSMRQVIELLATLISVNPDESLSISIRAKILHRLLSIISHHGAQPLVKPALKAMECLLSKGTLSAIELVHVYGDISHRRKASPGCRLTSASYVQDCFVENVFDWMSLPDTAPAAGKLLVSFWKILRKSFVQVTSDAPAAHIFLWQRWIRQGLARYPDSLENIKNYLFPPLFKLDRIGSLEFLQEISHGVMIDTFGSREMDGQALLLLSAIEVGKQLGLIDEMSSNSPRQEFFKAQKFVVLPEDVVGSLLSHNSSTVRSSAFSVLTSSISSIRPFSPRTLSVLQQNLDILHADTDARFRNEVLSNSKHMIERLRGAMTYLTRETEGPAISENIGLGENPGRVVPKSIANRSPASPQNETKNRELLSSHASFLQWYLQFLSAELIPTASYQRHITALRSFEQLANSGIMSANHVEKGQNAALSQFAWPFTINLFIPSVIHLLLDLLMDPFEDVRASACSLLKLASRNDFRDDSALDKILSGSLVSVQVKNRHMTDSTLLDFVRSEYKHGSTTDGLKELGMLLSFINFVEDASNRTGRADLADAVARAYELLSCLLPNDCSRHRLVDALVSGLELKVIQAEISLPRAVIIAPIHGQFASLSLIWGTILKSCVDNQVTLYPALGGTEVPPQSVNWNELQSRMVRCCEKIWMCVKHVLCNDSPEGHLLQSLENMELIDTKDILSYSFRSIHESSNLLRTMVNKLLPRAAGGFHLLSTELFQRAGTLTFSQLSYLRHRGAFSTVSLTFSRCCQLTRDYGSKEGESTGLLQEWYQAAIFCIYNQVSTTRRSAGIPALITGVLSANCKAPSFDDVLSELKDIARKPLTLSEKDEIALPQVHAINCLKEIFKSSTLGKRSENHIAECLEIAADSLNSGVWAVRNCGLLLLRSLIDSLFGTSESKAITEIGWDGRSIKLSYERYPALPELLIRLLTVVPKSQISSKSAPTVDVESVFPALDIIRRAGPPTRCREELFSLVTQHLGSNIWHMRDIAARTVCTLLLHDKWLPEVLNLLETSSRSLNQRHGILLAIRYLLERRLELNPDTASEGLKSILPKVHTLGMGCAILEAAYLDFLTVVSKITAFESYSSFFPGDGTQLNNSLFSASFESLPDVSADKSLLRKAAALNILGNEVLSGQFNNLRKTLVFTAQYDVDTCLFILDGLPLNLKTSETAPETLANLRDIYILVLSNTQSHEVRGVALRDLTAVLEHRSVTPASEEIMVPFELLATQFLSLPFIGGPELTSAEIRITGALLLQKSLSIQHPTTTFAQQVEAWGEMLEGSLEAHNDFDTRYAAVMALGAFYRVFHVKILRFPTKSCFVPSILALYDTLNDDDNDIRDAGAGIVSEMFGSCYASMAAGREMLPWCLRTVGSTDSFRRAVLGRLTGMKGTTNELRPAVDQLKIALQSDDSLFIEEEHNLYVDEVREILLWNSLVSAAVDRMWDSIFESLSAWVLEGLLVLQEVVSIQRYGWASKPKAFAIFMRIVVAAKTVVSRVHNNNEQGLLEDASWRLIDGSERVSIIEHRLENLASLCTEHRVHPLLVEELIQR